MKYNNYSEYVFYNNLPEEIKSKIMFSSGIEHPVATIFKDFRDEYTELLNNRFNLETLIYEKIPFYDYLIETGYFRTITLTFEELENIISLHLYIPDDSD